MPRVASEPDSGEAFLGEVLGRVPGLNLSRFFAEHWGRAPLWVRPQPSSAPPLLTLPAIDALIEAHPERMRNGQGIKFAMGGQIIGQHLGEGAVVTAADAHDGFARGASVIIHEIEQLSPPIAAVASTLERELGVFASANMYLTPHTKRAFGK